MTYLATSQLMTLTYFLKVEDLNRDHLGSLNMTTSHTVTDIANITIANT